MSSKIYIFFLSLLFVAVLVGALSAIGLQYQPPAGRTTVLGEESAEIACRAYGESCEKNQTCCSGLMCQNVPGPRIFSIFRIMPSLPKCFPEISPTRPVPTTPVTTVTPNQCENLEKLKIQLQTAIAEMERQCSISPTLTPTPRVTTPYPTKYPTPAPRATDPPPPTPADF